MTIALNLLASIDLMIEEANITRMAVRLGMCQPALSAQRAAKRDRQASFYLRDPK
jgi:DNA-binding transcriptional LysR family regulator